MSGARTPLNALGATIFVLGEDLHNSSAFTSKWASHPPPPPVLPGSCSCSICAGSGSCGSREWQVGAWYLLCSGCCSSQLHPELLRIPIISHPTQRILLPRREFQKLRGQGWRARKEIASSGRTELSTSCPHQRVEELGVDFQPGHRGIPKARKAGKDHRSFHPAPRVIESHSAVNLWIQRRGSYCRKKPEAVGFIVYEYIKQEYWEFLSEILRENPGVRKSCAAPLAPKIFVKLNYPEPRPNPSRDPHGTLWAGLGICRCQVLTAPGARRRN